MPDDTVKDINLAIPSTPIQEHPQSVTLIPRRRKRRGDQETDGEGEKDDGAESGALGTIEDKVTISSSISVKEDQERSGSEKKKEEKKSKQENGVDIKHIDIKV